MLSHLLARRDAVLSKWLDATFSTYPPDTAKFLRGRKDPFGNPVGATICRELATLLDAFLGDAPEEDLRRPLDAILRIRSVQGLTASAAVSFVFQLKGILRDESADSRSGEAEDEWPELERRIDRLGMMAFDSYVGLREEIFELRVQEAKRQVSWWLRKASAGSDALKDQQDRAEPQRANTGGHSEV